MTEKSYAVPGFHFAAIHAGIKENPAKLDLALIYSEVPASIAATFTTNRLKAAPVRLDLEKIKKASGQAIIINSGNANVATGSTGMKAALAMVSETAKRLKVPPDLVYVSSTGKIGSPFPTQKVVQSIPRLVQKLAPQNLLEAAEGILTTDRFIKVHGIQSRIGKTPYTLVGFAKGAGMTEPAMKAATGKHATMLAYFVTDLAISSKTLQAAFNRVVDASFNRITVDGDMSTNDTAMILANGLARNPSVREGSKELKSFEKNLEEMARVLALKMVEDGEGATKVVEISIRGAKSEKEARQAAYRVGRSQLVKTAFFGEDPNWGRLMAALGYSGVTFDPDKVDIYYDRVKLASRGVLASKEAEKKAHEVMKNKNFTVTLDLKQGKGNFKIWASDLTVDYVKLNAEYRT